MKFLVFDAGPLISLTLSGLLEIVEKLKKDLVDVRFIITPQVRREVIDRAMSIKKYKLEAVKISDLIERGILEKSERFIDNKELAKETANVLNKSRKILGADREMINLIQEGEASCLAFCKLGKFNSLIVIDERTTRLLSESIENLKELMTRKLHTPIFIHPEELNYFKDFRYIRSSELAFLAYKKGLIALKKNEDTLDAILYSLKFHGTAISSREIEEMKKII